MSINNKLNMKEKDTIVNVDIFLTDWEPRFADLRYSSKVYINARYAVWPAVGEMGIHYSHQGFL